MTKTIEITNIVYDLEGMMGFKSYVEEGTTREDVLKELPSTATISNEDDIAPEEIQSVLEDNSGWMVKGFSYELNGSIEEFSEAPIAEQMKRFS